MMKDRLIRHYQWGIPVALLAVAILGARLQCLGLLYALIGLICLIVVLVAFGKIDERKYPYILFAMGLALLYQVTLISPYLVGTDIHYEYYYANLTVEKGYWDYTIPVTYNSAFVTTALFPIIAKVLHIDIVWLFKVIPPLFLAGVGVVMYFMFKQMIGEKLAFLSCFFFLSIPTYFLELTGIAKQQIAELFFIICFFLLVDRSLKLGMRWRLPIIAVSIIITAIAHYTMGGAIFYYLVIVFVLLFVLRYAFKMYVQIPLRYFGLVIVVVVALSTLFYSVAGGGEPLREIVNRGVTSIEVVKVYYERWEESRAEDGDLAVIKDDGKNETVGYDDGDKAVDKKDDGKVVEGKDNGKEGVSIFEPSRVAPPIKYERGFSAIMKAALGLDFAEVSPLGKVFRVLQYMTQALLVVGCVYLFIKRKRFTAEYLACGCASAVILFLCVALPTFSPILNATRFYHIALMFLAPVVILAGKLIFRDYRILVCCLLVPYFIFTSGVVYEVAKYDSLATLDLPYSNSLSGKRVDSTGIYTEADGVVRQWIVDNDILPIASDMWGNIFLNEKLGPNRSDVVEFKRGIPRFDKWVPLSKVHLGIPVHIPWDVYIFLRERNEEHQEVTRYTGIGTRGILTYEELHMARLLEGREVVFQCGNAKVYGPWQR